MKKVPVQKIRLIFRTVVLCAVLSGLLFSCGEGIRLFPFPAVEKTKNDRNKLNFEDKILYQFNAPRFEDTQGNFKTKSQRNSQHQHQWTENGAVNNPPFSLIVTGKPSKHSTLSANLKRILYSESGESRAPPFRV